MEGTKRRPSQKESVLIKKASNGDKEAFDKLYKNYHNSIKGYIVSHLVDRSYTEDIEQETWSKISQIICDYDPKRGSFYSFIRYWAGIMVLRVNSKIFKWWKEQLFSEFPDEGESENGEESIDRKNFKPSDTSPEYFLEKCEKFLKITFKCGGLPHQLIAFGFNKLLTGWGPNEIVEELSSERLKVLTEKLIMDYKQESKLPDYIVDKAFKPLKKKMRKKVKDVLGQRDLENLYEKLLDKIIGVTKLENYYGKNPVGNIADWSYKVREKVMREIKK